MDAYLKYLRSKIEDEDEDKLCAGSDSAGQVLSVGIVGAGISGLYSALLLQRYIPNVKVKLFEANDRVGGRIFTHKFSVEPYQYCEAGAMRIPNPTDSPSPVIQLVKYLNKSGSGCSLKLIDFVNSCPSGNRVFVNGTTMKDGRVMTVEYANAHCSELGFRNIEDDDQIHKLFMEALKPVLLELKFNFDDAVAKFEGVSLQQCLKDEAGWDDEKILYYGTMLSLTNANRYGVIDAATVFGIVMSSDH